MRHLPTLIRFAAVASTALLLLSACFSGGAGEFSTALGKKLQSGRPAEVNLSTITPLHWDELFIFGPYSIREDSCRTLQLGWFECRTTLPSAVSEGEYILVFRTNAKVVHSEHHSRANGDFYSQTTQRPQPIKRSAAKFTVEPVSNVLPQGTQWFRLEHKR